MLVICSYVDDVILWLWTFDYWIRAVHRMISEGTIDLVNACMYSESKDSMSTTYTDVHISTIPWQ